MVSYKLVGKIVKVDGECSAGHHVDEEFDLTLFSEEMKQAMRAHRTPNMCAFFYDVLFPYLVTLQFGGSFPWERDKDLLEAGCPDNYKVVMQIRRQRVT
jgi:uncharacterized repeat protein (TIGR04076 family)